MDHFESKPLAKPQSGVGMPEIPTTPPGEGVTGKPRQNSLGNAGPNIRRDAVVESANSAQALRRKELADLLGGGNYRKLSRLTGLSESSLRILSADNVRDLDYLATKMR